MFIPAAKQGWVDKKGVTKAPFICYHKGMKKLGCALLLFITLFSACAQTPDEKASSPGAASSKGPQKRTFFYRVEASSQTVGFNVLINGTELLVSETPRPSGVSTAINDWMISGNNEISITIFWPDGVTFTPGTSAASFKLFSNDTLLKEFLWPATGVPDQKNSYPFSITETFKADGFPKVSLERAERVISSAGVLPLSDQEVIAARASELRKAFTEKNIAAIDELLKTKYADLAVARFTTPAAVKEEANEQYAELMGKDNYTVSPPTRRNSYSSTADDRVVRVTQGRIGFPEPALVITWKEGRATRRWDMELYFAKIDGNWVIIR